MTERSLETVDTPSLLIDRDRLERNLAWMQEKADRFGVKLRPHTKTHRCPALARRQGRGAEGGAAVLRDRGVPEDRTVLEKPADATGTGGTNAASRRVDVTVRK